MKILGIETSCDETAAALVEADRASMRVCAQTVASQIPVHQRYGGVVPEVAARCHAEAIVPVIKKTIGRVRPDVIAVTSGPGLATALLVGVEAARTLSYAWQAPIVGVNHIEGHICANFLSSGTRTQKIRFPALALVVSGGHTEMIVMRAQGQYALIGKTMDDAVGECFDKVGKMLGLPYPGGPAISMRAAKGSRFHIPLPRPMLKDNNFSFSFSGLKTAALYYLNAHPVKHSRDINDFCASFEQAAVDVLVSKTIRAATQYGVRTALLGGGVAANAHLRSSLSSALRTALPAVHLRMPARTYCTDNAAMIAAAGYFHARKKQFTAWQNLAIDPEWELAV